MSSLAPPRGQQSYPLRISSPLPLPQLSTLLNLLNQALDIIDISTWTGDPKNGSFISGQLRLLADIIDEARAVMRGGEDVVGGKWWEDDCAGDETVSQILLSISNESRAWEFRYSGFKVSCFPSTCFLTVYRTPVNCELMNNLRFSPHPFPRLSPPTSL